jgi:hypothetical protein
MNRHGGEDSYEKRARYCSPQTIYIIQNADGPRQKRVTIVLADRKRKWHPLRARLSLTGTSLFQSVSVQAPSRTNEETVDMNSDVPGQRRLVRRGQLEHPLLSHLDSNRSFMAANQDGDYEIYIVTPGKSLCNWPQQSQTQRMVRPMCAKNK